MGGLVRQYDRIKQKNNQTDTARTDWKWYEQLDEILGTRETTSPSFISDGLTANIESMTQKEQGIEPKSKKSKTSTSSISDAILTMSLARERMWEKKYEIQEKELEFKKQKVEKDLTIEKDKLEIEKLKTHAELEKIKIQLEHERQLKEMEYKYKSNNNHVSG